MTLLTIQCAWPNKRGTSRFAASVDAAENPGIMSHGDSMRDEAGSNHRCRTAGSVAWATRVAAGTLCLLVHGCEPGHGGAVELSWKLRPASSSLMDKFVDCNSRQPGTGAVTDIRLHWQMDASGDSGANEGYKSWPCDYNNGVTGFEVPEGIVDLSVTPECMYGQASHGTYIAPAPVRRYVTRGDTVSLGAVEIVVSVSHCRGAAPVDAGVADAGVPTDAGIPTDAGVPLQPCICDGS